MGKSFSGGEEYSFFDKKVHLVFPSAGKISSEMLAASLEGIGVRSSAVPVYDFRALKLGRANTLCKECLPLQLTIGGMLKYIEERKDQDEMLAYFMPFTPIQVSPIGIRSFISAWGVRTLISEALWVWFPLAIAVSVVQATRYYLHRKR